MKQITTILLAGSAILFMTACGGGSSDSSVLPIDGGVIIPPVTELPVTEPKYRISMDGSPYKKTLTQDSKVIMNMHCVNTALYDTDGDFVYSNDVVPAGDYLLEVTRKFTDTPEYDDSKGVFYSLPSGYALEKVELSKTYSVPTRTRDLYELDVSQDNTYVVSTDESNINVYDENLTMIESHATVFTLTQGTYYIQTLNYACSSSTGSFSISLY